MYKIIFLLLFLFINTTKGQVHLIDSISREPIVGANIYSNEGKSLGISDINGVVNVSRLSNSSLDKVLIQHISYNSKEVSAQIFSEASTVLLVPRSVQMDSVVLQHVNNYDYVILKGYFRTYDLFNNKPKYFYDGIVEYYIPIKNNKRVYHKVLAYRLFENQESLNEYVEIFGKLFLEPPKLFTVKKESYLDYVSKDCVFVEKNDKIEIMRNGLSMGFIQKTKTNNTQIYFDKVPPHSKISRSFFRLKGELYRGLIVENYFGENIKKPSLVNLISKTRSSIGSVQRKKAHGFIPMEMFEEFYVLERTYLLNKDIDNLKGHFTKSIYLGDKSQYNERFWEHLDAYNVPSLSSVLQSTLNSELVEK